MASQIQICNLALGYLGAEPVLSIDEETKTGRCLKLAWDLVRDEVLACHAWNFSTRRAALAVLEEAPEFEWSYQYELPGDCLRVLAAKSEDLEVPWVVEGGMLLSNVEDIEIRYLARITATGRFTPGFVAALAARLGAELALTLTESSSRFESLYKLYGARLAQAKKDDVREQNFTEADDSDSWLAARGATNIVTPVTADE